VAVLGNQCLPYGLKDTGCDDAASGTHDADNSTFLL